MSSYDIWFDVYVPFIMGAIMLFAFIGRFYQLSYSARHLHKSYNKSLYLRISLLMSAIAFNIGLSFLSLYDQEFYLYQDKLSSIYLFESTIYAAQMGTMMYEYNKNVPMMSLHKIYWIIQCVANIAEAINNTVIGNFEIITQILLWGIVLSQIILITYSIWYRKQDIYEFEDISGFVLQVPEVDERESNEVPIQSSFIGGGLTSSIGHFRVRLQFGRDFKVNMINGEYTIQIKIRVIISNPTQSHQLIKTIQDFVALEQQLLREDRFGLDIYKLPIEFYRESAEGESNIVQKVGILKNYLNQIISKIEYYLPSLIEFLEFDENCKGALYREQRRRSNSIDESF